MGKALHFSFTKPSLLKGPFRYSKNSKTSDDDVPDLASSSCASDQDSNNKKSLVQPSSVAQEATLSIEKGVSEQRQRPQEQDDETSQEIPCIQQDENKSYNNNNNNNNNNNETSDDHWSAVLNQQQQQDEGEVITADREQRLIVPNCIPSNIVLLPDFDESSQEDGSSEESSSSRSSLEDRLDHAQALIHSYRDTIRSNEHLIDSLHQTLTKTREEAMNVMSSHKDMEEAVQMLLEEREADSSMVPEPKVYLKMVMAASLMLYFFGFTTEYPLIATVMVFLLEGFL
ncbi:unnamed protein product [Cylindrotheca closterium]|uniref:Uncharacterized protein n=1 Tax=Cylindrotheca closterium TaxID=2856 RepID=A0AAD2G5R8_9STRA|nr:unnamed protein product [Cylindrotheca closterium]